jgi:hypothetical protein
MTVFLVLAVLMVAILACCSMLVGADVAWRVYSVVHSVQLSAGRRDSDLASCLIFLQSGRWIALSVKTYWTVAIGSLIGCRYWHIGPVSLSVNGLAHSGV